MIFTDRMIQVEVNKKFYRFGLDCQALRATDQLRVQHHSVDLPL